MGTTSPDRTRQHRLLDDGGHNLSRRVGERLPPDGASATSLDARGIISHGTSQAAASPDAPVSVSVLRPESIFNGVAHATPRSMFQGSIAYSTTRAATSVDAPGSITYQTTRAATSPDVPVRIARPSVLTVVGASVRRVDGEWLADRATVYRTARRLMEGLVYLRAPAL
jgi:hypothetical protein